MAREKTHLLIGVPLSQRASGDTMKALEIWRQQDLTPESRARLTELLDAQRHDPDDPARRDALLDAFLDTLTESQLVVFARLLREMTERVH